MRPQGGHEEPPGNPGVFRARQVSLLGLALTSCFDRIATLAAIWLFTSPSVLAVRLCSSWRVWGQAENLKRKYV